MASNSSVQVNDPDIAVMSKPASASPVHKRRLSRVLSLDDFEREAKRHLPRPIFGYIAGAAENNLSNRRNREAFDEYEFVPRVLVDVSKRSTATRLFDQTFAAPFGIAPMGLSALSAYRGDIVLATGAASENMPMVMSGSSLIRLEDVIRSTQSLVPGVPAWRRGGHRCTGPTRGRPPAFRPWCSPWTQPSRRNRENNVRAGFIDAVAPELAVAGHGITHPRWSLGTLLRTMAQHGMPHFENNYAQRGAPILSPNVERDLSYRGHLNWRHLQWSATPGRGARDQGHPERRRCQACRDGRGRHHRLQPRRAATRWPTAPLRVLAEIVAACPACP